MSLALKLDRAYDLGIIAFVSAQGIIIPIRARADIRATGGAIEIQFADCWLSVRPELIRFIRQSVNHNPREI